MKRMRIAAVLVLLLAGSTTPALAGPILINGSFESGPPMGGNHDINIPQGSTAIVGWLVTREDIELLGPPWDVSDGFHAVDLDGYHPGGIEQIFATIAGEIYEVSFAMSGNPMGSPQVKWLRVSAAGAFADYAFDSSGQSESALNWQTNLFSFTASGSWTTLGFSSLSTDANASYGALLDDVRVSGPEPVSVPDPGSTLLLFGMGLVGLRACRKQWQYQ